MRIIAERNVGETRAAVFDGDRPIELHLERWSERRTRAVRGEVYRGRVVSIDKVLNGAFIDLGKGPNGFLPLGKAGRIQGLHNGASIGVQVSREEFQDKGPTLSPFEIEQDGETPEAIAIAPPIDERLAMGFDAPVRTPKEAGIDLDPIFEAALEPNVTLSGGGQLIIEPVTALTAIDVDAAGRQAQSGGQKFILDLNKVAAREAGRQVRLRGIGGVVAIDFLPLKKRADQAALDQALKGAFRGDPAKIDIAPSSRFAIVELARQRLGRSLYEMCWERFGVLSAETCALAALRRLEREGRAQPGRPLTMDVGIDLFAWLESDPIGWQKSMTNRLGARFVMQQDAAPDPRAFRIRTRTE